ncbi:hypothetical protein NQ317_008032 [Molorchus minor]|uniref:Glycoside hydrolase family protein 48 n=1 Tax=Molorchus minor TaxID=1323400 RepID=A0ABQ9JQT5_9CUCU|nr:hypothetical protein NQ317_008032 [Molorchus minor]
MHDASNGYFSSDGIPYHSVETLMVEAPDHGHETTSEAFSYYIWLEAMYGAISGDFSSFNTAWGVMEKYIIPPTASQPSNSAYNPSKPATYAPELDHPSDYPSQLDTSVPVGQDPLFQELVDAYGTQEIYGMHWLLDVDNIYGFGNSPGNCEAGPDEPGPSYINTFQRGPEESVWRTIPQSTCESFKYGGEHGFLDLYLKEDSYAHQWKYTNAPDADARAVQAAFWAAQWATASGQISDISDTLEKAAKMGDYLRYALFDKYFKKIGNCIGPNACEGGNGKNSAHYLLSWYYAWGGALDNGGWAWRIADGAAHFGYQNPLTAYALANEPTLKPKGATAVDDWTTSLDRQLEFYEYLQTEEGAFAGGATNSWKGRYETPDSNLTTNTFHGMFYDWEPVYHDPPSNRWYGMQPWSVDRLAQFYYVTGNTRAEALLNKWVSWFLSVSTISADGYQIPDHLTWTGLPGDDLHVTVETYNDDVGTGAATARALSYYAAKTNNEEAKTAAKNILDVMWNNFQTDKGVTDVETREDYSRFNEPIYVPPGWTGTYPDGDVIDSTSTFISLRSFYLDDPDYPVVEAYLNGGSVPTFTYHRFWAQSDVAIAQGAYGLLFNE